MLVVQKDRFARDRLPDWEQYARQYDITLRGRGDERRADAPSTAASATR